MNARIDTLIAYPFQRLATLTGAITGNSTHAPVAWSLGEPRHPTPALVVDALADPELLAADLQRYPGTRGGDELRTVISAWLQRRYGCSVDPEREILPVNGTREALFAFAQAVTSSTGDGLVLMPVPFYQIYEGAALLAGHEPYYIPCRKEHGYKPAFDEVPEAVWDRCELLYICSPGNPTGAVLSSAELKRLLELAQRHDFVIAADECYSEIHFGTPPPGLLQVAAENGLDGYQRCVVFNSLSKRSNAPGLRSGFVAGDAAILARFLQYRTYHGSAMPLHTQRASVAAWSDEAHVEENRAAYKAKFDAVVPTLETVLGCGYPDAGFFLWAETPSDDCAFTVELLKHCNVRVLPGSYLGRDASVSGGDNPGKQHVRIALVEPLELCVEAAERVSAWLAAR